MAKVNLTTVIQKSSEFIKSLENIEEFSGEIKPDFFFSNKEEGTLYLNGDEFNQYRDCLRLLIEATGDEIISQKALEQLYQNTILFVLDIHKKRGNETFDQRLKVAINELQKSLRKTLVKFQIYYPINGLSVYPEIKLSRICEQAM